MTLFTELATDVGRERSLNEDSARIVPLGPSGTLLVVCDGMGGHEGGEVASAAAVEAICTGLAGDTPTLESLSAALVGAHAAVRQAAEDRGMPAMGTTAVVAWVVDDAAWVAWIGDSRFYHLRGRDRLRSQDHTRVARMVEMGILTAEQARGHPEAHILTQAIGGGPGIREPFKPGGWEQPLTLLHGDVLLLCSDGLYDLVEEEEIADLISGLDIKEAAVRLIATANDRGGHDNITIILGCVGTRSVPVLPPQAAAAAPVASRTFDPDAIPDSAPVLTAPSSQVDPGPVPVLAVPPRPPEPSPAAPVPPPNPSAVAPSSPPQGAGPVTLTLPMAAGLVIVTFLIGCVVGWQAREQLVSPGPAAHGR